MKLSEQWLREWANPAIDSQTLAEQITMAGLEVDNVAPVAGAFNDVVVARVIETAKHPEADKLTLCKVDNGQEVLSIVCGATNVRAGLLVALAQVGTVMPSGLKIKASKLRGELSQGMLCSASELGLAESSEGIMELSEDAPVGTDLRQYLQLNDRIIEVDLTPNRADCFSVLGVARELAALTDLPEPLFSPEPVTPQIDDILPVKLHAHQACSNYQARIIRNISVIAKTPLWMVERLRRSGLRSIHPVVDVTNLVMLECGQPMHAFNLHQIKNAIHVRYAKDGERVLLLDEQEKTLNAKVLVIADEEKVLAMAGIMGGLTSAVDESTTDIVLESAWFNPLAISGIARAHGLCTDSSQRFERGVDPSLQQRALERATALILEICGGAPGPLMAHSVEHPLEPEVIGFNPDKVKRLTGVDVSLSDMQKMLKALGMKFDCQNQKWLVTVPLWRFDIHAEVDLVEEIIRLYGYDKIQGSAMSGALCSGRFHAEEEKVFQLNRFFVARGYHETINYSFVDPVLQQVIYPEQATIDLLNPISTELSQMRLGLWPGLLASVIYNTHRQQNSLKLFESGVRFVQKDGQMQEELVFSAALTGERAPFYWGQTQRHLDFYDAKGDLGALFEQLCLANIDYIAGEHPALHPGQSAAILKDGQKIGDIGVLHPALAQEMDLSRAVVLFEISVTALTEAPAAHYHAISKFPTIRRDLSLLVKESVSIAAIEKLVREVLDAPMLKSFDVFDVYHGEHVPAGYKSLAISLAMQNFERTLVDDEINNKISAILQLLDEKLSIKLRE